MLGKLILKGGDVAATVQGLVDDAATLANPAATPVQKAIAAVSIASELGPVSLHDAKALKTLSQKLGQKGIDCLKASKATQKATEGLKGAQQKVEAVGDVNRGVKNARKGTDASPSGSATPGKQVSNPYGSKGKPDHQSKIDAAKAEQEFWTTIKSRLVETGIVGTVRLVVWLLFWGATFVAASRIGQLPALMSWLGHK